MNLLNSNNNKKKLISALLVILILVPNFLFFIPSRTNAQDTITGTVSEAPIFVPVAESGPVAKQTFWNRVLNGTTAGKTTISAGTDLKQWALKILEETLRNLAKKLLQKMTESTVNWINTGFHGAPLFVENPGSFFKDIAKYEIRNLVSMIGYDSNRYPFGKSFLIGAINSFKSTFEQNAQYSLSKVTNDPTLLQNFRSDFSVGGWDGFLLTTQFPQNNQIGSQMMYADYLANKLPQVQSATDKIKDTLEQGQGFLSPQTCESNIPSVKAKYNNLKNQFNQPSFKCSAKLEPPEDCIRIFLVGAGDETGKRFCEQRNDIKLSQYTRACELEKEGWDLTTGCKNSDGTDALVNTTPGSVVADQIMTSLSSPFRQGELGIAMGNSLSAIFDALLNQFFKKGLSALTSKQNTPPDDDFNYYGNTLGPNTTTTGANNGFDWNKSPVVPINIDNLCPVGQSGVPPNCITTSGCPAGQTGTPPNCVDACSAGETGIPPNCTLATGVCPAGQTGTPPNCVDTPTTSPPLSITTSLLPNAEVGVSYSESILATGGTGSYVWTSAGILPAGLTLTSTNCFTAPCQVPITISGIPMQAGTYNFTISVSSDPLVGDGATLTATKSFTLIVN